MKHLLKPLQASLLALAVALPGMTATPAMAKPGGIKPAFNAASKGGVKSVRPARPAGKAGGFKKPMPKKPGVRPTNRPGLPKVTRPHGKPKMNPGLPKPRKKPVTMGSRTSGKTTRDFNKVAKPKPLREIFNPAARPPVKPTKADPPPTPGLKPKGPTF